MITRVFFAPRKAGLTTAACLSHWKGTHSGIGARLPGIRRYVQNHGLLAAGRFLLPYPGFDIMPELDWDDVEAMDAAIDSPVHERDSLDDEASFIDVSRTGYAVAARRVLLDGQPGAGAVKLITLLHRSPEASTEDFHAALTGPYARAVAGSRPVRHEVLLAIAPRTGRPAFAVDGVDMIWFPTAEHALSWGASAGAYSAAWHLAGLAAGGDRLIARPHRVV